MRVSVGVGVGVGACISMDVSRYIYIDDKEI